MKSSPKSSQISLIVKYSLGKTAIQLVKFNKDLKQFEVVPEAAEILSQIKGNIGVIAFAGLYRTGKSFTLNLLLGQQELGFKVDPSTSSCTQGLWMWSDPIYVKESNLNIILIDTEGFSSIESHTTQDSKIFALVVLISSYLIYNTIGVIDEGAINSLSTAAELSKIVVVSNSNDNREDLLASLTPKFIWLLKDFTLELQDSNGKTITENDYLDDCLKNTV